MVEPAPRLGVEWLADAAQQPQAGQVVAPHPGLAEAHECADGRGGGVEGVDAVALDEVPPAVRVGVGRVSLVHEDGGAVEQRTVDEVAVAGDPARVRGAPPAVGVMDVEAVVEGGIGAHLVAAVGVQDRLGLAGGPGGVEDEQGILGVDLHGLAAALGDRELAQLVVPVVADGVHDRLGAGVAHDDDVLDGGREAHRVVDDLLHGEDLAVDPRAVGGDDDLGLRVIDARAQGVGGVAGEDHRVDGPELGAGEHGEEDLGDAGQVDRHNVALVHAHGPEDVGHPLDLPTKVEVGEGTHLLDVLTHPDEGERVTVGVGQVPVDGVGDDIRPSTDEPTVEGRPGLVEHRVPAPGPLQLAGALGPVTLQVRGGPLLQSAPVADPGVRDDLGVGMDGLLRLLHRLTRGPGHVP